MEYGIEIIGIPELQANMDAATREIYRRAAQALYEEALTVLEEAKRRTPVLTGSLRDSGRVEAPVITDTEVSVTIAFGDERVTWAIPVHERVYVKHITGRSKYLESVILERMDSMLANIASKCMI